VTDCTTGSGTTVAIGFVHHEDVADLHDAGLIA
jgi:hypothetical protein